jgi:hypothetical protein
MSGGIESGGKSTLKQKPIYNVPNLYVESNLSSVKRESGKNVISPTKDLHQNLSAETELTSSEEFLEKYTQLAKILGSGDINSEKNVLFSKKTMVKLVLSNKENVTLLHKTIINALKNQEIKSLNLPAYQPSHRDLFLKIFANKENSLNKKLSEREIIKVLDILDADINFVKENIEITNAKKRYNAFYDNFKERYDENSSKQAELALNPNQIILMSLLLLGSNYEEIKEADFKKYGYLYQRTDEETGVKIVLKVGEDHLAGHPPANPSGQQVGYPEPHVHAGPVIEGQDFTRHIGIS